MSDPELAGAAVTALSQYIVGDATLGDTLTRVAELTQRALPQASFVGVTMSLDGRLDTYVLTDPAMTEVERAQYDSGEGPCVEAFRQGEPQIIRSTSTERRWPAFCRVARRCGVGSTLSLPMATNRSVVGALNLYSKDEHAFEAAHAEVGRAFATQAAFLLANAQAYWDARSLSEHLGAAMSSRATIEQAKGIIMAAVGCSADEAFERLVVQSQHENVKLRDVAARIVRDVQRRR